MVLVGSGVLGLASKSLLGCWLFLELNSVAFVGLALSLKIQMKDLITYFMVQGVGSAGLVLSVAFSGEKGALSLLMFCVLLKLGAAPFHSWLVSLLSRVPWSVFFVLSIWQKLLPLIIFQSIIFKVSAVVGLSGISVLSGALFMLKSWQGQVILAGSSVYMLGWLMIVPFYSVAFLALIWGYGVGLAGVSLSHPHVDWGSWLNLSGLPPFSLFWGKLMALMMFLNSSAVLSGGLLSVAVISMYCYLRFLISNILKPQSEKVISASWSWWSVLSVGPCGVLLVGVH